jgi:hypothetical protein
MADAAYSRQEAQIDYGRLRMWLVAGSGRRHTVWTFVMVVACSRHMFVRPTLLMDQAEWTAAHVEAFAFFTGYAGLAPTRRPRPARVGSPSRSPWAVLALPGS